MHRFYGALVVDGVPYRVMTLMREEKHHIVGNGIHAYEVQKIEVLDEETPNTPNGVGSHPQSEIGSSYPLANLLQDVGKSYEKGKNLLDHRMYGAVQIDGNTYRAKTTMHEHYVKGNAPHDYRVTKIELLISGSPTSNALSNSIGEVLDGQTTKPLSVSSRKSNTPNGIELLDSTDGERTGLSSSYQSNSNGVGTLNSELEGYPLTKIIQKVGKTMETDKNLLDESKLADESADLYRDQDETEDIWYAGRDSVRFVLISDTQRWYD